MKYFNSDYVMIVLLLAVLVAVIASVYRQHRSHNSFNLFDLLMANGKLSHGHVFASGGWLLHTWTVAYWTLQGSVKSEDFLVYSGIWVTPFLAQLFKGTPTIAEPNKCGKPEVKPDAG